MDLSDIADASESGAKIPAAPRVPRTHQHNTRAAAS
jgi:hypothetical protein